MGKNEEKLLSKEELEELFNENEIIAKQLLQDMKVIYGEEIVSNMRSGHKLM